MKKKKIIVKTSSCNLWWGIYGFCEKTDWEDIELFYENGERIGGVCLQTKSHLRPALNDLKKDPEEANFVIAIEEFLTDNKCHYWYYYDKDRNDEHFYEVPYNAPANNNGIKPRFMDIWHPDEEIDILTIKSSIKEFANKFLDLRDCTIEIENDESFEKSLENFNEHQRVFNGAKPIEISFSEELILKLSNLWKKSKKEVLDKLNKSL